MDPKLVSMLADYMEKTGSLSAETRNLVDRMYQHIEKQDDAKTASVMLLKDRAGALAQKMASVRMLSGQPMIEGYDMVKQASGMMLTHSEALDLLDMVLDTVQIDRQKQASLEPGRPSGQTDLAATERSAAEELMFDCGVAS